MMTVTLTEKAFFQNSTSFVLVNEKGIKDVNELKKYSSIHSTKMDDILKLLRDIYDS